MKHRTHYVLLLLLTMSSITAISQNSNGQKPKLFSNFPEKMDCIISEFNTAFAATDNQQVNLSLTTNFSFTGTVISNSIKYGNMQTVVIKLPLYDNAVLVLTKITTVNNKTEYKGRIVNTKYFDGYTLKKDDNNNYQLIKFETGRLLEDCKQ